MAKSTRKPEPTPEQVAEFSSPTVPRDFGLQIPQLAGLALGLIVCVVVGSWAFSDSDVPQAQRLQHALRFFDEHRDRSEGDCRRAPIPVLPGSRICRRRSLYARRRRLSRGR